jgi:hypothetical protein
MAKVQRTAVPGSAVRHTPNTSSSKRLRRVISLKRSLPGSDERKRCPQHGHPH